MSLDILKRWVAESTRIVFLGGAGVSTESGIRDFRGVDGLYNLDFEFPPERIISRSFFETDPEYFYRFYRERLLPLGYSPNVTHFKLAQWENEGKLSCVITQNIDGLHQAAGSKKVYEFHGSVHRNYCICCQKRYSSEFIKNSNGIPLCQCGGIVRPDITLYEERPNPEVMAQSIQAIQDADMLIVGGTSLTVYPAAGLIDYFEGDRLVLINRDETPYDYRADLVFHESIGEIFSQLP